MILLRHFVIFKIGRQLPRIVDRIGRERLHEATFAKGVPVTAVDPDIAAIVVAVFFGGAADRDRAHIDRLFGQHFALRKEHSGGLGPGRVALWIIVFGAQECFGVIVVINTASPKRERIGFARLDHQIGVERCGLIGC